MPVSDLNEAIIRGLEFLRSAQEDDGGFVSWSSASIDDFTAPRPYRTTFTPALVLGALSSVSDPRAEPIRAKTARFLLSQKSRLWTFNYWARDAAEAKNKPYPDDLDDTFCALLALYNYNRALIDGRALAKVVELLSELEVKEGGPYRTWVVAKNAPSIWRDVDLAVNANIASFLGALEIELPHLTALAHQALRMDKVNSPYYPTAYPIVYYLSRWYRGPELLPVIEQLGKARKSPPPLFVALGATSLLNLDTPPEAVQPSIRFLLETQEKDGSWPAHGFCFDPAEEGKARYAGSRALTTALVLESLSRFQSAAGVTKQQPRRSEERLYQESIGLVIKRFEQFNRAFRTQALKRLEKLLTHDHDRQIVLMPYFVAQAAAKPVSRRLLMRLGAASLFGWFGYTLLDDFLDEEGDPPSLPIALVAFREAIVLFREAASRKAELSEKVDELFDRIERANFLEVTRARARIEGKKIILPDTFLSFGRVSELSDRSIGHALGPLAVLVSLGYSPESREGRLLERFFSFYLAARQLHDDAHDWEEDLRHGRLNGVSARLVRFLSSRSYPLEVLVHQLSRTMWEREISSVCGTIIRYCQISRQALHQNPAIVELDRLESFVTATEESARQTLEEQQKALAFLNAYGTS